MNAKGIQRSCVASQRGALNGQTPLGTQRVVGLSIQFIYPFMDSNHIRVVCILHPTRVGITSLGVQWGLVCGIPWAYNMALFIPFRLHPMGTIYGILCVCHHIANSLPLLCVYRGWLRQSSNNNTLMSLHWPPQRGLH